MTPQRAIAVMTVYECLILFGVDVLNGKALAEAWEERITEDLWLIIDKRALHADELRALDQNVVPLPEEAPGSSISTWAKRHAGKLLGHGEHWYRKQEKKYPRLQRESSRIAPDGAKRRKSHPGEYDRFTRYERKFLSLPDEAQSLILAAVRKAMESEQPARIRDPKVFRKVLQQRKDATSGGFVTNTRDPFTGPIQAYFRRSAEERDEVKTGSRLIPPSLKRCIARAINSVPEPLRSRVRASVWRHYPGGGKANSHLRIDWPIPPLGAPKRSPR